MSVAIELFHSSFTVWYYELFEKPFKDHEKRIGVDNLVPVDAGGNVGGYWC